MSEADGKRKDVEFRKNVLADFLKNLKQAQNQFFKDCDRLESEHPGMSFEDKLRKAPKLQLEAPWGDAMGVILDGLDRALVGESDPFQLKGPRSGQVKISDLDRFDIAVNAYRLWKKKVAVRSQPAPKPLRNTVSMGRRLVMRRLGSHLILGYTWVSDCLMRNIVKHNAN